MPRVGLLHAAQHSSSFLGVKCNANFQAGYAAHAIMRMACHDEVAYAGTTSPKAAWHALQTHSIMTTHIYM